MYSDSRNICFQSLCTLCTNVPVQSRFTTAIDPRIHYVENIVMFFCLSFLPLDLTFDSQDDEEIVNLVNRSLATLLDVKILVQHDGPGAIWLCFVIKR